MFKAMLVPALVLAAASAALPAAAQSYGYNSHNAPSARPTYGSWMSIGQRQANIERRIRNGLANRSLSSREAASIRSDFNALSRLETTYRRNGMNDWEHHDLDRRYNLLSDRIHDQRADSNGVIRH